MSLDPTTRAEARALLEVAGKATPGPWRVDVYQDHDGPPDCDDIVVAADLGEQIGPVASTWEHFWGQRQVTREVAAANAAFIASAPRLAQLLGQALDALEESEQERERLQLALFFWLPSIAGEDSERGTRAGNDSALLYGMNATDAEFRDSAEERGWIAVPGRKP